MANLPYISPELLESYQKEISAQTSQATSKRKMASLKKFFGWAKTEGHIPENPIEAIAPLPQPPLKATPKKPLKVSNIIKIGALVGMAVLVFLLVGRVKLPIPFRLAPAGEPTASLFPTASPTSTPSSVAVSPTPAPSLREEVDPIFSKIYQDGVLTLEGTESAIKSIGGLLIEAASLVLKTEDNTDGDIEIAPDGSGIAHFLFEGTGENFLNAQAPNLTSGSLYYGIVANNSTGYNLLKLQSGSNPTTRFSVDALGNTYLGGNITIGNNLIIGGATRFTNLGRLASITGYYQDSGLFQIDQGGPDYAKITKDGVSATADSVTFTLDETGQTASGYDTMVLSRLNGGTDAFALLVDDGNAQFDGQLRLGRFSTNPGTIGTGSIVYNTTDNKVYFWNGSAWTEVGAGGSVSFTDLTSGTNITAAMIVGTGASLTYSGSGTINATTLNSIPDTSFLRSDTSDNFTSGTLTTNAGTTFDVNGDLEVSDANVSFNAVGTTFTTTGDLTLSLGGGDLIFSNDNTFNVGGSGSDVLYSVIGDTVAGASASMDSDDDLYIEGNLEVDGTIFGNLSGSITCTDCLDFTEFADNLTLDVATDIALGALTLSTSGTGALNFASTGQVTFAGNVNATNGLDVTVADLTVGGANFSVAQASGDITSAGDAHINGGAIDSTGSLSITSATTNTITLDSGTTGNVNVGTGANAKSITIGNVTTTTTINLTKGASGNIVLTGFNCTSPTYTNGGALTTDASGNIACSDDDSGAGTISWSGLTNPTTFLTLAFDNGEDNTFSYVHSTGDHSAWTFNYSQTDDIVATDDFDAMTFNLSSESGDAGDTFDGIVINWANGTANTILDSAIKIDNAEDTTATLTDAIIITSSGVANGVTDAIDVSATNLNNAINTGANFILFDGLRAFEGTTGTLTLEDTGGNDMALFVDQGTTGSLEITDSLQVGASAPLAYSRFGTTATSHSGAGNIDDFDDLVINDDLEVDGTLWLDGGVIHNSAGTLTVQLSSSPTNAFSQLTASSWLVDNTANLGMAALAVNQGLGTDGTTDIFTASSGGVTRFRINKDGGTYITGTASTLLTVGAGSGKIDVGTVDPVYNIGGTKYATYMAGMIGVKEETAGNVNTQEYIPGVGYRQLIDFKNQETGSDLWLFSKATNLRENLGKMIVLLTPSVNTKTWYSLDKENYTLSIYSLRPTSVSYRFTAPRFDYALWTNYNYNPEAEGFKISNEEIALNPNGEVTPDPSLTFADFSIEGGSSGYELKDKLGQAVEGFEAFADFIAANIKAGAIETKELLAEKIVSPKVETALLSPLPDESNVTVQIGKAQEDGGSGFGELIIQDATGSSVASIDSLGNASFEGRVESKSLQVASEATVAGTLYANDIKSTTLDDIQSLLREVEADQNLLAQSSNWNTNTSTEAATIYQQLSVNDLFVTNTLAATTLSLSTSLTIGADLVIQNNSINTLSAPLTIQSLSMAPIELMAGKVKIETNGDVAISGNLYVAGKIESTGLNIKSSSEADESIAQIDASGSGTFKSVTTDDLVVASSQTSDVSSIVNGEITTNATVGQAVIPAGTSELTIRNPKITDFTLVYVTPTSSTSNHVLYVKAKSAGFFSVGFSEPLETDVSFNWWIVSIIQ